MDVDGRRTGGGKLEHGLMEGRSPTRRTDRMEASG